MSSERQVAPVIRLHSFMFIILQADRLSPQIAAVHRIIAFATVTSTPVEPTGAGHGISFVEDEREEARHAH
jgi:hypothetical protein